MPVVAGGTDPARLMWLGFRSARGHRPRLRRPQFLLSPMDGGEGSFHPQRSSMPTKSCVPHHPQSFRCPDSPIYSLIAWKAWISGRPRTTPFASKPGTSGWPADRDPFNYEFFKQSQLEMCGSFAAIDISANAAGDFRSPTKAAIFALQVFSRLGRSFSAFYLAFRNAPAWRNTGTQFWPSGQY